MGRRQGPEVIDAKTASIADRVVNAILNGMANAVLKEQVSPKVVASTKLTVASIQDNKTENPLAPYVVSAITVSTIVDVFPYVPAESMIPEGFKPLKDVTTGSFSEKDED